MLKGLEPLRRNLNLCTGKTGKVPQGTDSISIHPKFSQASAQRLLQLQAKQAREDLQLAADFAIVHMTCFTGKGEGSVVRHAPRFREVLRPRKVW